MNTEARITVEIYVPIDHDSRRYPFGPTKPDTGTEAERVDKAAKRVQRFIEGLAEPAGWSLVEVSAAQPWDPEG
jgi:hypothetical protein